ncbi:hypothetical protein SO802_021891 [Lithocarpus litseifolius]|uniref:Uncharacterized protein n=1 Tax=Lithocarpus litseifolius TaxID=425828 RepID=A0AAW2CGA1_9ROSI
MLRSPTQLVLVDANPTSINALPAEPIVPVTFAYFFFFNVVVHVELVAVHEIGHLLGLGYSSVAVALDQYALGAIVISIFVLVVAIYSFFIAKKKVVGEARTKAVNCVAAAAATINEECRSANAANANVIIVGAGVAGSALAHTLGKPSPTTHTFTPSFTAAATTPLRGSAPYRGYLLD